MNATDTTFWDLFRQGGFMMWVMLTVSMFALSLMIEAAVRLRAKAVVPPELFRQIKSLIRRGDYHEAWRIATAQPCPFSRVVAAGLERVGEGKDAANEALEERALQEAVMMKTRVNYLSVIGVVSPMLGLIGTVVGMIKAFRAISEVMGQPLHLAEAIGEVLVATAFGLFIAVPAFFAYYFFRNRAQAMIALLQDRVGRVMARLPYPELQGLRIGEDAEEEDVAAPAFTAEAAVPALVGATVPCPNCRQPIVPGAPVCPSCEARLEWT